MNFKKGFTLVELLVVIAIIGVLSSVVLASLSPAREKAKDASAQLSLSQMRAAASMYADNNGNKYSLDIDVAEFNVIGTTANVTNLCDDEEILRLANAVNAQTSKPVMCTVGQNGQSYAIYASLLGSITDHAYCIDSNGFAGDVQISGDGATYVAGTESADALCK